VSVLVLTALFFIDFLILRENLPDYIPNTPIKVSGLYLFLCYMGVYYVVFKRILKENDTISVGYLTIFGFLIALFSEIIFQCYRVAVLTDVSNAERAWSYARSILMTSVFSSILSFMMAIDIKYKFWWARWISTIIGVGLMFAFKYAAEYLHLM